MSTPENTPPQEIEILIVEDSPTQAMQLRHLLERRDYRVTATRNGKEALAIFEQRVPTLVVTDINMPEMDGYELCQRVKDDGRLKHVPVILLTSLSNPEDILKGLECGADNFIVKPYDEEFLLSRIQYVLTNLELRKQAQGAHATEIFFAGHKYRLTSDRIHSIDLLLSTYETAVQKNLELSKAKETLEIQAEQLRERNEQMQADLDLARELQSAFLPRQYPVFPACSSPEQSALRFCHRYFTTTELGGDFFEILAVSDTQAGVFICDVMGHGVRAALVSAIVRGLVEELKPSAADPGKLLTEVNASLCAILKQTLTPLFATAFYLVADVARGVVSYANAGHPSPFHLRRAAGALEPLTCGEGKPGPALGIFKEAAYSEYRRPIAPQDLVMLYTDGLYEVEGADGKFYDLQQLHAAISRRSALPTTQLFDELLAEIRQFGARHDFEDDMCLVGIELARLVPSQL
ncbi:MAG: fused response regulator/phosphatase [Verrucomicrobiota bacterium]|nr:fused response regulator/phosphatase [Verrucomicrobiota bacterium]